jgi:hypothetical protein
MTIANAKVANAHGPFLGNGNEHVVPIQWTRLPAQSGNAPKDP